MNETFKFSVAGLSSVAGSVATLKGLALAAGPVISTAKISAVGSMVGGAIGGVVGSGVGIATGGTAIAGTVPLAAAGAAVGAWAGPALAVFGIGTAPVWAMPVAVIGGVLNAGGLGYLGYRATSAALRRRRQAIAMGEDKLSPRSRAGKFDQPGGEDRPDRDPQD